MVIKLPEPAQWIRLALYGGRVVITTDKGVYLRFDNGTIRKIEP